MIKLNIQFFGGRGSSSSSGGNRASTGHGYGGTGEPLGLAGQTGFYDGNKVSVRSTLDHWEGKSYGLDHEELLMIDEDGFATAYFKGGKDAVSFIPPDEAIAKKTVLTHNHPLGDGRTIGGGFSNADIENHIKYKFKETRATAVEGTYSFKATSKANSQGFLKALKGRKNEVSKKADAYMKKNPNANSIDVYLKESHKWYQKAAKKYGFEYKLETR